MQISLSGQYALVTGASRGIGRAIALQLGQSGATVIGTATSEQGAQAITTWLQEQSIAGQGLCLEVTDPTSVANVLQAMADSYAAPTILVNNAGITRDNLLLRMKDTEWDAVIATNLSAIYRLSKAVLRGMMKQRSGRIINITSASAVMGNAGQSNYAAAKAGVIGFTKALAREVGSRGITVNAVAPGFIDTDMTSALAEPQVDELTKQIPLGRFGSVAEIAAAVVFLATPQAAYITGETLHVNGGLYMA